MELDQKFLVDICKPGEEETEMPELLIPSLYKDNLKTIRDFAKFEPSEIFTEAIKDAMDDATNEKMLTPEEEVTMLFNAISRGKRSFEEIGKKLADYSLCLKDVVRYFGKYKTDIESLVSQLGLIQNLLLIKLDKTSLEKKIDCFFKLETYQESATIVNNVSKHLGIEQTFSAIEKIQQMQNLENLEATIGEITEDVLDCQIVLSKWTRETFEALEIVIECMKLVSWIRANMDSFQGHQHNLQMQ